MFLKLLLPKTCIAIRNFIQIFYSLRLVCTSVVASNVLAVNVFVARELNSFQADAI